MLQVNPNATAADLDVKRHIKEDRRNGTWVVVPVWRRWRGTDMKSVWMTQIRAPAGRH